MKIIKIRKWTLIYCVELFSRDGEIFLRIFSRAKREFFLCESLRTYIFKKTRLLVLIVCVSIQQLIYSPNRLTPTRDSTVYAFHTCFIYDKCIGYMTARLYRALFWILTDFISVKWILLLKCIIIISI